MRPIRILVTSSGSPGTTTLVRKLRGVSEREVSVVAVDMNNEAGGRFLADAFYPIPPACDEKLYIQSIIDILIKEKIDVFFPVSDAEVPIVARNKKYISSKSGAKIIINNYEAILSSGNKHTLYETLISRTDVQVPRYYFPSNLDEFISCAKLLGFPDKKVCFKPPVSKGSRGFRILIDSVNRRDLLLNYKPNSLYMSMEEFVSIFKNEKFPDLLIMEFLDGKHYDAMVLGNGERSLLTTIKIREDTRWGTIVKGEVVRNQSIAKACTQIVKEFGLIYNNSIQFIEDKVIEVNPRTSTYIYDKDFNEPYFSVKKILGELTDSEIEKMSDEIPYGKRICRYMDQVSFWNDDVL
jgi:carbamoyl-phosphate synthase large subunit